MTRNIFTLHILHHEHSDNKSFISFREDDVGKWYDIALLTGVTQVYNTNFIQTKGGSNLAGASVFVQPLSVDVGIARN